MASSVSSKQTWGTDTASPDRVSLRAAARWLALHDRGLNRKEERQFARWLGADGRHQAAWAEAQRAWSRLDRLPELCWTKASTLRPYRAWWGRKFVPISLPS